jgi:hypothetical protein
MTRSNTSRRSFLAGLAGSLPLAGTAALAAPRAVVPAPARDPELDEMSRWDGDRLCPADIALSFTLYITLAGLEAVASRVCDSWDADACDESCDYYGEALAVRTNAGNYKGRYECLIPFDSGQRARRDLLQKPLPDAQRVAFTDEDGAKLLQVSLATAIIAIRRCQQVHWQRCRDGIFCMDFEGQEITLDWALCGVQGSSSAVLRSWSRLFRTGADPMAPTVEVTSEDIEAMESGHDPLAVKLSGRQLETVAVHAARSILT